MKPSKNIYYLDWLLQAIALSSSLFFLFQNNLTDKSIAIGLGTLLLSIHFLRDQRPWARFLKWSVLIALVILFILPQNLFFAWMVAWIQGWYFIESTVDCIHLYNRPRSFWDL